MNYTEAWQELNDKLYKAKHALQDMSSKYYQSNPAEYRRLQIKKEGIELAIQYMFDIERSI